MKRILTLSALLLVSASLFAAKPLKVASGSLDVLKEDVSAVATIDLSQAMFEDEKDFKTWCEGEYDTRVKLINDSFFEYFNKYSKGMKLVKDDAPYQLVFAIKKFERKMGANFGQFSMKIDGTITIVDKASGETVCQLDVDGIKGAADFVENDRFPKTMDTLCKEISKLK